MRHVNRSHHTMKKLSNSEIKARLIFVVGVTLSFVFGISMLGILYGVLFVVQPLEPSPTDQEFLSILNPAFMALLGLLGGVLASNGLRDKEKDKDDQH
jgi:hypothetical protein